MRGRAAAGEMCAVAAQPHSTRATSDVLCGAVVANSTAGGAAGGAGLVTVGRCIRPAVAFAAGSPTIFIAAVRVAASAKPAVAVTRATG